ncbi:MAG: signal transduction histidine kinase [Nitriliruptoraceae bacterium]|jgi:signal transduction histidine kinase
MRRRLTGLVAATSSLIAIAFLVPLLILTIRAAYDQALRPAELAVRSIAPAVALTDDATLQQVLEVAAGDGLDVGVLRADGTSIGAATPDILRQTVDDLQQAGTVDLLNGVAVVTPIIRSDGTWVVYAIVPTSETRAGVLRASLTLVGLAVILVLAGTVVAGQLARHTLEAVQRLEDTAHELGRGNLRATSDIEEPEELAQVGRVLDGLAGRIANLLAAEREAAADLSHRLRTPLTPLRLDAAAIGDPVDRERIQEHVDRLDHAVSHVIRTMQSIEPSTDVPRSADIRQVAAERIAFWSALAEDEERPLAGRLPDNQIRVQLSESESRDLLDVLLDNAFTHTPTGTPVTVTLTTVDGQARLTVADAGPGFDPDAQQRGRSSLPTGTGLGLDIARRLASRAGGTTTLASSPSGTTVTLILPTLP